MSGVLEFAALPYNAVSDQRLSEIDLKVLAAVASHERFGKNGLACTASRDTLAEETGFNPHNVSSSLGKLVKYRYVLQSAGKKDGRKKSYSVVYNTNRRFARIPIAAMSDRRLNKVLFRTLAAISAHDPGTEKGCFAQDLALAKSAGIDTNAVRRAIAALDAAGYIFETMSPAGPPLRRLFVAAWRKEAGPQFMAAEPPIETEPSEYDFDTAVRERLPYGRPLPSDRLPAASAKAFGNNGLVKRIYWSEDLLTKNPAEAGGQRSKIAGFERATNNVDPYSEAILALQAIGVDRRLAWTILLTLPDFEREQFLSKAADGCLTPLDLNEARRLANTLDRVN